MTVDAPRRQHVAAPAQACLPRHVAIIMDGNGRWARQRNLPRVVGHQRGVEAVRRAVKAASALWVEILTIYSFSAENWSRPIDEVSELMSLLKRFIRSDLQELHASGVQIRIIGERLSLDPDIAALLDEAETLTRNNSRLKLVVAFNYGGRQELVEAARILARRVAAGTLDPAAITADMLAEGLHTHDIGDPDMVIRTSGEQRLSNFLLWQSAYSEFVFLPVLWPDFDQTWFETALAEYASRERRFGGVSSKAGM